MPYLLTCGQAGFEHSYLSGTDEMTPQEKKKLSLERDCRNSYGENDKSSRKSIRFRKRWVNRTFRRETSQAIEAARIGEVQEGVAKVQRKSWRKIADIPLGKKLHRNRIWAMEHDLLSASQIDPGFVNDLREFLSRQNISVSRLRVVMRRCRASTMDLCCSKLGLNREDLDMLEKFLRERRSR